VPAILVERKDNKMVDKKESARLAKRLGKNVADRRKQLGWTQEHIAEHVSVDAETISRFERGVNLPSLPTLEKLSVALNASISDLLSKQRPEEASEAAILATWIAGLSPGDRSFVMTVVKNCCDYLRSRGK
jgi:transcriptional regulator with XRE-family HTH domain